MNCLKNLYLKIGDKLFEKTDYVEALSYYQKAYEEEKSCPEALTRIQEKYILPQESDFQQNYTMNRKITDCIVEYEECQIDFVPVSDGIYKLFDKETRSFCGSFDFGAYTNKKESEKTFQSVLVADNWDAREVLSILNQHIWNNVYIVLNHSAKKFLSFLKLPDFVSLLPEKIHIFGTTQAMCNYFEKYPTAYLPHVIFAEAQKEYEDVREKIHQKRIQSETYNDNVFLSICIPSYNRGKMALEAVQWALKMKYDTEIEVLVSDNGSYIGKEEYKQIRNIDDSRVQYYRLKKNEGLAANICNCLEKAKGYFAILFSDEDRLILEGLEPLLDYLWNNQELGGFIVQEGPNAKGVTGTRPDWTEKRYQKGIEALNRAWKTWYMSALGFCVDKLKQHNFLQNIDISMQSSGRIDSVYPHSTILVFLAQYYDFYNIPIPLWFHTGECKTGGYEASEDGFGQVKQYTIPKNRMEQEASSLKIMESFLTLEDYKIALLERVRAIFFNISIDNLFYHKYPEHSYNWTDIQVLHYENCLKIIQNSKWGMDAFDESFFQELDEVFFHWLDCRRIRPIYSEKENLKATLRVQLARYSWEHGVPFLEIDFQGIDEKLEKVIGTLS